MLYTLSNDPNDFPPPESAFETPNGLLACGGDLSVPRLISAYSKGIFPWYDTPPILWWCPDPRCVLYPQNFVVSRSLKKALKKADISIQFDHNFAGIIQACSLPRKDQSGTWITPEMQKAYIQLFDMGYAHCVEVYQDQQLVGGIYGVVLGKIFFGESMFSLIPNASKLAIYHLIEHMSTHHFQLIDCQVPSAHLMSLGATLIPRAQFLKILNENNKLKTNNQKWSV